MDQARSMPFTGRAQMLAALTAWKEYGINLCEGAYK